MVDCWVSFPGHHVVALHALGPSHKASVFNDLWMRLNHMSFSRITLHVALKLWKGIVTFQMILSSWNFLSHKVYFHFALVSFPSELVLHFDLAANACQDARGRRGQTGMEKARVMDKEGGQTLSGSGGEKVSGLILHFSFQVNIWVNQTLWYWVILYTFIQ